MTNLWVFLSLMIPLTASGLQYSITEIQEQALSYQQRVIDTPMKITYNEVSTMFYPRSPVLEKLPDGKLRIEDRDSGGMINGKYPTVDAAFSRRGWGQTTERLENY